MEVLDRAPAVSRACTLWYHIMKGTSRISSRIATAANAAGAGSGAHFNLRIVSARFAGLPRVARHRLVYDALRPWMAEGVHALAIDARTPDEV